MRVRLIASSYSRAQLDMHFYAYVDFFSFLNRHWLHEHNYGSFVVNVVDCASTATKDI